jgi:hypothetical protein
MRRGFSIMLVLLFALAPLAPALHASAEDSSLPACCRRNGVHHCALAARAAQTRDEAQRGSSPTVSAPSTCPYYPGPATLSTGPAPALAGSATVPRAPLKAAITPAPRSFAVGSRPARSHAGRGPPAAI